MKPKFITIEGIEGAGKTTAIEFVREYLWQRNIAHVLTREPGGTKIAEDIRSILLYHHQEKMHQDTELLLMFASRAQHLANVIKPALQANKWVICDRFTDASFAYQGGGRGIDEQRIAILEDFVQGELRPDLVLIMDLPVAVGLERATKNNAPDRIESEQHEFFNRVRNCYLARAKRYPDRYRVINAEASLEEVKQQILEILDMIITVT